MAKRKTKGGLPKFCSGGSLFQGSALPSVTQTTTQQTTAPQFYTNYLQDIANVGQNAVQQGGVAGLSPLQQQAFAMAPCAAFAGAGTTGAASQLIGQSGGTTANQVVGCYLNPYACAVIGNMQRLSQQNLQQNVLPAINAAGASTGQFGSQRQAQATGNALRCIQSNLVGQEANYLSCQYNKAIGQAQTCLSRELQSGQALGNLGVQQNQLGVAGLNELNTLGAACQAQAQKELCYPMTQAGQYAKLLQGYQIPTGGVTQVCGPMAGAYSNSPLSQIAGLGSLIGAFTGAKATKCAAGGAVGHKDGGEICHAHGAVPKKIIAYHDGKGHVYDLNGNLVG